MTSDEVPQDHRLHPLSLLFRVGKTLRGMLIPLILIVFASQEGAWDVWVLVAAGVSIVHAVFHYVTYRYRFDGDELVVRHGVLFRSERHVPYERIQNIDLRQNPFHRLLGVADVRIETASGAEAEADMSVLSLQAVETMRARVFAARSAPEAAGRPPLLPAEGADSVDPPHDRSRLASGDPGDEVLHLRLADLVLFGIISNRGMAVVLAALGLAYELDLFPDEAPDLEGVEVPDTSAPLEAALWGLALIVAVVVLLRVLSVSWAIVNLHGFSLRRRGDDLRTSCGLLTRLSATIPRQRIQVVTVTESLLHRLFRRAAVKVDTAGGSVLEERSATRQWVAPLIPVERLPELLAEIQPETSIAGLEWHAVDHRAWRRLVKRRFVVCGLLGAAATWHWGPWAALGAVALFALAVVDARRRIAAMGWALDGSAAYLRRGLWTKTLRIVRYPKVQVLAASTSPFDRRWGMASITIDTAGTESAIELPFLPATDARAIVAHLQAHAAQTAFRW